MTLRAQGRIVTNCFWASVLTAASISVGKVWSDPSTVSGGWQFCKHSFEISFIVSVYWGDSCLISPAAHIYLTLTQAFVYKKFLLKFLYQNSQIHLKIMNLEHGQRRTIAHLCCSTRALPASTPSIPVKYCRMCASWLLLCFPHGERSSHT